MLVKVLNLLILPYHLVIQKNNYLRRKIASHTKQDMLPIRLRINLRQKTWFMIHSIDVHCSTHNPALLRLSLIQNTNITLLRPIKIVPLSLSSSMKHTAAALAFLFGAVDAGTNTTVAPTLFILRTEDPTLLPTPAPVTPFPTDNPTLDPITLAPATPFPTEARPLAQSPTLFPTSAPTFYPTFEPVCASHFCCKQMPESGFF